MISKEALRRGFNRGKYVVGKHTPPYFANDESTPGETSLQTDPVVVTSEIVEQIRATGAEVLTDDSDVIWWTRDWWARSMIAETSGNPATPVAVIVRIFDERQVIAVMKIASDNRIPVTASAGRSNVTGAAMPLRGGIVLDLCELNQITGWDPESQIVEVQAGMFLDVFEDQIQSQYGMTCGNWPSSYGVATIGGQVACRGAGQLSTRYGKIEDMVWGLDVVLANGDLITVGESARSAVGPDLKNLFVGSEGTLGIVTRARLMVHRLPNDGAWVAYGFESFAAGLSACRELMQRGATPAVLRLYDNIESGIIFGLPDTNVLLVADEGERRLLDAGMAICREVCAERGTALDADQIMEIWLDTRFVTGKSADGFKSSPGFVADTLEMTGRWRDLAAIYADVVKALESVPGTMAASAHQSHAYVSAGCIYFSLRGTVDPEQRASWYEQAWNSANEVILRFNASLSHHHGVGLLRSRFMERSLGAGFEVLRTIKQALDPDNILNPGKLGLP